MRRSSSNLTRALRYVNIERTVKDTWWWWFLSAHFGRVRRSSHRLLQSITFKTDKKHCYLRMTKRVALWSVVFVFRWHRQVRWIRDDELEEGYHQGMNVQLIKVIGSHQASLSSFLFHHSSTGIDSRFGHGAAVANGACGDEKTWKWFFLLLPALDQLLQIHWPFITDSLTCQSCEHVSNWFTLCSVYDNLCNMKSKSQRATVLRDAR